uniref:Uncharacterized protein n=1 Tax=Anser cygnoides TaxID=8845 RepID=A0A8B9E2B3_ANSCY
RRATKMIKGLEGRDNSIYVCLSLTVCMHVCLPLCVCICMHRSVSFCGCVCICLPVCEHASVSTNVQVCASISISLCVHVNISLCVHVHTRMGISLYVYVCASVLGLSGMESPFPAHTVLCSALIAGTALVSLQCCV